MGLMNNLYQEKKKNNQRWKLNFRKKIDERIIERFPQT